MPGLRGTPRWLPGSRQADNFSYDIPLPKDIRRRPRRTGAALEAASALRIRKPTYKDRAVALARTREFVTPDQLGGVCVYRCQIAKLCALGLLEKVAYGRYRLGPAVTTDPEEREIAA